MEERVFSYKFGLGAGAECMIHPDLEARRQESSAHLEEPYVHNRRYIVAMTEQPSYRPLDKGDFRLLVLDPGPPQDPNISVRLVQCRLQSAPPYDALSYVWGDQSQMSTILLDAKPFQVTANLHWALRRIRDPLEVQVIWADAICINQLDLQERSQQVAMMGSIFSSASRVLVCMGDPPRSGEDEDVSSLMNGFALLWGRHPNIPFLREDDPLQTDPRWRSVGTFMLLPWFRRAWVIQEVGLARDPRVLYGRCEFGYREMLRVMRWVSGQMWAVQFAIPSLLVHREWYDWTESKHPLTFTDLLSHGALLDCSDPRDRVYAFLGHPMARNEDGGPLIFPDYVKSVDQVYLDVSCVLLQRFGLRLLSSVEHREETIVDELPSWVVRWNVSVVMNDIARYPQCHQATPPQWAPDLSKVIVGNKLELPGALLDTVSKAYIIDVRSTPEVSLRFIDVSNTARNLSWSNILGEFPHRANASDAILKSLCARDDLDPSKLRIPENKQRFEHGVKDVGINRCLLATAKGGFGIGPLITRPGDVCCVLFGTDVPFILRPSRGSSGYRILGEAFVHGVMNGEIAGMLQRGHIVQQTITII
ncbi:hypothetical protein N8I77_007149 [Diaporthe amygdali]|uniref:Heterokaryon incompatibility domain-containing protein n=1 Tax=Phomopsis amygdali TaxID=1214568 RepID=A0AAD9SB34_PHOAM|nr:hypothetical protein N8I77_007149 [Diaporthe amygdali]